MDIIKFLEKSTLPFDPNNTVGYSAYDLFGGKEYLKNNPEFLSLIENIEGADLFLAERGKTVGSSKMNPELQDIIVKNEKTFYPSIPTLREYYKKYKEFQDDEFYKSNVIDAKLIKSEPAKKPSGYDEYITGINTVKQILDEIDYIKNGNYSPDDISSLSSDLQNLFTLTKGLPNIKLKSPSDLQPYFSNTDDTLSTNFYKPEKFNNPLEKSILNELEDSMVNIFGKSWKEKLFVEKEIKPLLKSKEEPSVIEQSIQSKLSQIKLDDTTDDTYLKSIGLDKFLNKKTKEETPSKQEESVNQIISPTKTGEVDLEARRKRLAAEDAEDAYITSKGKKALPVLTPVLTPSTPPPVVTNEIKPSEEPEIVLSNNNQSTPEEGEEEETNISNVTQPILQKPEAVQNNEIGFNTSEESFENEQNLSSSDNTFSNSSDNESNQQNTEEPQSISENNFQNNSNSSSGNNTETNQLLVQLISEIKKLSNILISKNSKSLAH